jgi:flagellar biosynthetic protein FlhB
MSENSTPEQRTELPTDKRMGQLRKEGTLFFSQDIVVLLTLMTGFLVVSATASTLTENLKIVLAHSYSLIGQREIMTLKEIEAGVLGTAALIVPSLLIISGVIGAVATLAVMLQTGWNIREKLIRFRWDMLNPVEGIKRIFSIMGLVTTGKAILKLLLILPVGYFALKGFAPEMVNLMHLSIGDILPYTASAIETVFWKITYILIALAVFDFVYGKHHWLSRNKMTKEEVKDERKSVEGDEETKRRIAAKGIQRIMQRLKTAVPKADVVVTNPTHYAVALKYDRNSMVAPIVVAKGQGHVALRIRQLAREAGVPVLERKPLARALFASTEVGATIPHELFRAVAEVLAYVFRLRNPHGQPVRAK